MRRTGLLRIGVVISAAKRRHRQQLLQHLQSRLSIYRPYKLSKLPSNGGGSYTLGKATTPTPFPSTIKTMTVAATTVKENNSHDNNNDSSNTKSNTNGEKRNSTNHSSNDNNRKAKNTV